MFLAVWLVYALHVVPGGGVNPNRSFDLTHSLVNEHSVTIDAYHENTIDKGFKDGHYYSLGLPGASLVGIPAYLIFKVIYRILPASLVKPLSNVQSFKQGQQVGFYQRDNTEFFLSTIWITWFSLSLLSAFAAVVLFKLFLGLAVSRGDSLMATAAYAFGTPVFFFSTTYFSHVFAASFVIFALYLLLKLSTSAKAGTFMLLGLMAAAAVLMEYQALFMAGGLAVYVLLKWKLKASWSFFVGAAIPCAILLIYNAAAFGGPFHSAYEFVVGPNAQFHSVGALGFTIPRPSRLFGLTFAPHRGLFIYSPVLLLSIVGFAAALRQRKQPAYPIVLLSILAAVGCWLWIASFQAWDGSSSFGPRLLVSILPFMAVGVALSLAKVPRWISIPLIVLSVAINWLGAQTGFAENIRDPFRAFFTSGFTLPALSALTSHSRGDNPLTSFVANRMWLITAIYVAVVVGCFILVVSATLRRRSGVVAEEDLAVSNVAG
ncbi:MAG: ArnT family glycosyltransferase [Acidobacteriota bacterium]